jgi:ubiquinone/menaquinone biosynthesis C-methylase UbiE
MSKNNLNEIERLRKIWNDHADAYDSWYETFEGAVENYVDWELLNRYLPKNKNARILDAAGGTGRIALPLAKMGYSVTLCDISPAMLNVVRRKMPGEKTSDKTGIVECDVRHLPFASNSFDLVLCWDGHIEAASELIRVTKRSGTVSIFLYNKWATAISDFYENPESTLGLIESSPGYRESEAGRQRFVGVEEAREFFETEGVRVIDMYAVCHWLDVLRMPEEILKSRNWDEDFFQQTTAMVLRLAKEPSVMGISRHLVVYGEKR